MDDDDDDDDDDDVWGENRECKPLMPSRVKRELLCAFASWSLEPMHL